MYAVVFDLDANCLGECYDGNTYHGAYKLVRDFLTENGFSHTQGSDTSETRAWMPLNASSRFKNWQRNILGSLRVRRTFACFVLKTTTISYRPSDNRVSKHIDRVLRLNQYKVSATGTRRLLVTLNNVK